jgi:hypothetical protein
MRGEPNTHNTPQLNYHYQYIHVATEASNRAVDLVRCGGGITLHWLLRDVIAKIVGK